jgi:hypothetical protein
MSCLVLSCLVLSGFTAASPQDHLLLLAFVHALSKPNSLQPLPHFPLLYVAPSLFYVLPRA